MEKIVLADLNFLDIGNKIQIAGLIMSDGRTDYYCYLPENEVLGDQRLLDMGVRDWEKFVAQTDYLETEILAKDKTGKLAKVILRKSTRQIDAGVSWEVFARDNYTCRYCGINGVPLTVDHIVLWESGGPSIEANLVSACRKCNKLRGNMQYEEWVKCDTYLSRSVNLAEEVRDKNLALILQLDKIPRKFHITSR